MHTEFGTLHELHDRAERRHVACPTARRGAECREPLARLSRGRELELASGRGGERHNLACYENVLGKFYVKQIYVNPK